MMFYMKEQITWFLQHKFAKRKKDFEKKIFESKVTNQPNGIFGLYLNQDSNLP